jgi:hypothetical protein
MGSEVKKCEGCGGPLLGSGGRIASSLCINCRTVGNELLKKINSGELRVDLKAWGAKNKGWLSHD